MNVILHVTHTDINVDARILREISSIADMGGVKVYGVGISDPNSQISQFTNNKNYILCGVSIKSRSFKLLPRSLRRLISYTEFLFAMFYQCLKTKPQIVHCHDVPALPVAVVYKIISRCILVYDAHELESCKNAQGPIVSAIVRLIERLSWRWIDFFISVSGSIVSWYNSEFGKKNSSVILNSPSKENNFSPCGNSIGYFRSVYKIPIDKKIFLYLGLFMPGRGIEKIIEVFSAGSVRSHVVFVGDGVLEDMIKEHALRFDNIHLHSRVPHDHVVALSKSADIGLCMIESISLSDCYSLPNKLFEYTVAELPVLASDLPEISAFVERHNIGWVVQCSASSIASAVLNIENMLTMPVARNIELLSWEAQAFKLQNIYSQLIHEIK